MLPELNIVMDNEGGCPDISTVTFDEKVALEDYHRIIKEADDVLTDAELSGMEENDFTEIDGVKYRNIDQYGDQHATLYGVKVELLRPGTFGSFFQAVLSDLAKTHEWDEPYTAICPTYHDGRWIDMILNGYLTNQTAEDTAAVIDANRYGKTPT